MSIIIQQVTFRYTDGTDLFHDISFTVNKGNKVALTGNNGTGKSTLLQIIGNRLKPSSGTVACSSIPYCIPQHFGQYDDWSIAEVLGITSKLAALKAILEGDASAENFTILEDDWEVEDKALAVLAQWGLESFSLNQPMKTLSGGEKTKVFLSGVRLHQPEMILMDEPTNHLDSASRMRLAFCCLMISNNIPDLFVLDEPTNNIDLRNVEILASTIQNYKGSVIIVSHDSVFKEEIGVERRVELQ